MADIAKVKRNIQRMIDAKAPEADIDAYVASEGVSLEELRAAPKEQSTFTNAVRPLEFGARGFKEGVADTIGYVPELVAGGMRAVGLPAPEKGFYPDAINEGLDAFGETVSAPVNRALGYTDSNGQPTGDFGPGDPQGSVERFAHGAGRGASDAAAFMVPGLALSKAAGITGNVGKAMTTQPVAQTIAGMTGGGVTESTDNPYLGMAAAALTPAAGAALARGGKRLVTPFPSHLSANEKRLAEAAERMGIKLTAGQKTGSPALRTMESTFGQLPFTAKTQGGLYDAQRAAFNREVLSKAGIIADEASPQVLDDAFTAIGRQFDDLAARTTVRIDQKFADDIATVANEYGRRLPTDVAPVFKSYMDDLSAATSQIANKPEIAGKVYQAISSSIKRRMRSAGNNPDLQQALGKLSAALDDTLERSATPELKAMWQDVRNKYRNLLTIDKAMGSGTQADRVAADIPFSGLKTAVKSMDKTGYARGRGDLNEASRVGDFLGSAIPPDSGTPRRMMMTGLLTGGTGGSAGYAAATGNPGTAAMLAALGLGGPKLAQMAYNSPPLQSYLKNQLIQPTQGNLTQLMANALTAQQLGDTTEVGVR